MKPLACLLLLIPTLALAQSVTRTPAFLGAATRVVAAPAGYTAYATTFDGSSRMTNNTVYLANGGKLCTISVWFKLNGGNGTTMQICTWRNDSSILRRNSDNTITFGVRSSAHNPAWLWNGTNQFTSASGWVHFAASFNSASTATRFVYINGTAVSDASWSSYWVDETLLTSDIPTLGIGSTYGGSQQFNGCLAELWMGTQYIDLSANISKFISGGLPVSLGSDGSTPTGVAPEFYFKNAYSTFNVNAGSVSVTMGVGGTLSSCTAP
jgi:hypothetical protein